MFPSCKFCREVPCDGCILCAYNRVMARNFPATVMRETGLTSDQLQIPDADYDAALRRFSDAWQMPDLSERSIVEMLLRA